ncbi:MAG: hypothetical protein JEY71_10255 [Sphaerochaeta sp.]|nr:hypothetical protein [Sphaerochaeta sp.]
MALGKPVLANKTRFPDEKPKPAPASNPSHAGTGQELLKKNIVVDVGLFRRLEKYVYEQKTSFGQSGTSNSSVIRKALHLYLTDKGY